MSDSDVKTKVNSLNISSFENSNQTGESGTSSADSKNCLSINCTLASHIKNVPKKDLKDRKKTTMTDARIIPSRYKQAANDASRKAMLVNESSPSNSGGSFDKSRRRPEKIVSRSHMAASMGNLAQMESSFCVKNRTLFKPRKAKDTHRKLHSTALNSTFFERTQLGSVDSFSTTVVGGHKGFHGNRGSQTLESLSELPDISQICPSAPKASPTSPEITVISVSKEKEEEEEDNVLRDEEERDWTADEMKAEYLQYLTWCYVDAKSEDAFGKQVREAEKQISLLTELIEDEEDKLSQNRTRLGILRHHTKVCEAHASLQDKFTPLNGSVSHSQLALDALSGDLEAQMNHIKLDNVYLPAEEAPYKENLLESLRECSSLFQSLNADLKPKTDRLESLSSLVNNLNEEITAIEPCLAQGEKAASLAIQEASLKLTSKSSTD